MATLLENLETRRDAIAAELAAGTANSDPPRMESLLRQLAEIRKAIKQEESPAEVFSRAIT